MSSRLEKLRIPLRTLLLSTAVAVLAGCGSAWRAVPVGTVDESTQALGEFARFTLKDDRVIEMRVAALHYPWVEGQRVVGEWTNGRTLRVDLREVSKIEVRGAS